MNDIHEYHLIDKTTGVRMLVVCSKAKIEDYFHAGVIQDAVHAINYLRLRDKEIADRYELRYSGESKERPAGLVGLE